MSHILIKDGYGAEKYRKATGTGTAADPFVPVTTLEHDALVPPMVVIGGALQTDDVKVTMDSEPLEDTAAGDLAAINVSTAALATNIPDTAAGDLATINTSTAALATNIPDTAAGDLATINTSTATIAAAVSTEMQCDIVAELPAGTQNIGDVDIATLPAANLGQQAMAASVSVVPASDVTDATYIGDIKFGEELPAGTQNIGDVDVASLPSGNLGMQAMAASLSTTPASDITDATYIGDIKFGEELPAGTQNIGDVDVATLPAANVGQQAMAASLSIVPANNITDATYIGDVKFGEELPAGTQLLGKVGIDQVSANANEVVVKSITAGSNIIGQVSIDQTTPGTTNAVHASIVGTKGSVTTAHNAITDTATSSEVDCTGYNGLVVHATMSDSKEWVVKVTGCPTTGGTFVDCYDAGTQMTFTSDVGKCILWKGIPEFIKIVATENADGGSCTVKVQPVMI